jgi:hypothetical protein
MILLAYYGFGGLRAIRLNDSGKALDGAPLDLGAKGGYAFRAASNGSDFLVVWNEGSNYWQFPPPNRREVFAARVMANGSVDASPIAVATGPADQGDPEVASDGRDYLVVYSEMSPSESSSNIVAKRVLREGVLAASTAEAKGTFIGSQNYLPRDVSHTAEGYYVVWQERPEQYRVDLMLRRVSDAGVPGDVSVIASDPDWMEAAVNDAAPLLVAYSRYVDDPKGPPVARVFIRPLSALPRSRGVRLR